MKRAPHVSQKLASMLEKAKPMTPAARERQVVSLAYGNVKLEEERVTRSLVEGAARKKG
jgi:hypothetical protein